MAVKRGRPRKYDYEELEKATEVVGSRAKTVRGRQNVELAGRAYMAITKVRESPNIPEEDKEAFQRLLDNMRPSVFTELGRFMEDEESEESIMKFGEGVKFLIANPDMSAKQAIRYLRRLRLGGGDALTTGRALHDALIRTINEYLERYPDLGQDEVLVALEITMNQCEKMGESEADSE
jgi:hypothetical protein